MKIDEALKKFATARQSEIIEAVNTEGSLRKAAAKLGLKNKASVQDAITAVKKKAALHGVSDDSLAGGVSDPYIVRGKSTLYDADGVARMTWVKTTLDQQLAGEAIKEWITWLVQDAKGLAPAVPAPKHTDSDLLAVYPMGDPHFGMYAWGKENGGQPYDLEIAERDTRAAIDRLVASAPNSDEALLIELGDFFHADNSTARTPKSGAQLDVDTRWQRVMQVGLRTMIYVILRTLAKHKHVTVRIVQGNHDPHSSVALALALDAYFHEEKRVDISLSPNPFWYFQWGKVLIGATHGDTSKPDDLPRVMAADVPKKWGETEFRYWYHGHIHHDSVKEFPGCMIESFRTLAAKDAWHNSSGYRSGRDMKVIVHHKDFGEVERHRIDIAQLQGENK